MKRLSLFLIFVLSLLSSAIASEAPRTAEELIAHNLKARGGAEKIHALKTLRMTGTYQEGQTKINFRIDRKRPRLFRVTWSVVGQPDANGSEGWDGAAWEFYAPSKVIRTTGVPFQTTWRGSDFDDSFLDHALKGHKLVLRAPDTVSGHSVFVLDVVHVDDYKETFYFDAATYLVLTSKKTAPIHAKGAAVETLTHYEDYRPVEGVLFPFKVVDRRKTTGEEMNIVKWETIEANLPVEDRWFSPPEIKAKTTAKSD